MSQAFYHPPKKEALIHLSGVNKIYQSTAGLFTALKDVDLDFYQGEFVGVIGKSGSGKSTLVNMLTGIDHPTEGKVTVGGKDIHALKEGEQARWRGLNMGVVFQFFQLLPMLTLVENVLLPMDFCDRYDPDSRMGRAIDMLALVGLAEDAHKLPGSISGGQQQSAAIARALANDPPIIVADEPTGNLDAKTADSVYGTFEALAEQGRTIIMITHDPEIESRLSRTVLLSDGEVIDPILAHTLPWLPHPALRVLGHQIQRRVIGKSEPLDVSNTYANQLILIESGACGLSFAHKPYQGKRVTLSAGAYFAGEKVISDSKWGQFTAASTSESTAIATLSWDAINQALESVPDGRSRLLRELQRCVLGEGKDVHDREGVIR